MPACSFPGGLKERPAWREREKDPTSILRNAVVGMLPKNRLRKVRAASSCVQHPGSCYNNILITRSWCCVWDLHAWHLLALFLEARFMRSAWCIHERGDRMLICALAVGTGEEAAHIPGRGPSLRGPSGPRALGNAPPAAARARAAV